jgi:predicted RNA-binding protein Jag
MKSIVEEASSIAKAIEKSWTRAGKPREFSIKIFEDAEKNFLGMTTKPAKIAIFFEESATSINAPANRTVKPQAAYEQKREHQREQPRPQASERPDRREPRQSAPAQERPERMDRQDRQERPARPDRRENEQRNQRPERPDRDQERNIDRNQPRDTSRDMQRDQAPKSQADEATGEKAPKRNGWTPEMVDIADLWVHGTLKAMNVGHATFTSHVAGNSLRYTFNKSITESEDKERLLFSSFANLILATLRSKFKREFRYLKVVLNTL